MQKTAEQWLDLIQKRHPTEIDLGLERIKIVADNMGINPGDAKVITVAGTNGKGSTCAILESILLSAGYSCGRYASPHLIKFNERINLSGKQVSDAFLVSAFEEIEKNRNGVSLSYFEFATLAAFWCFQQQRLDVWIIEVGLGGRLDASNIIDADVGVVTSIALDHDDWLGSDLTVIGREKAGIFRKNQFVVCGEAEHNRGVVDFAQQLNCQLALQGTDYGFLSQDNSWSWYGIDNKKKPVSFNQLPVPGLPRVNAATAIQALYFSDLEITKKSIIDGLVSVSLAGRLQVIRIDDVEFILDVAHNPHAAQYIVTELKMQNRVPEVMIIGMLSDKDISGTLTELNKLHCSTVYFVSLDEPRGQSAAQMAEYAPAEIAVTQFESFEEAIQASRKNFKRILICGSFHTVGKSIQYLKGFL